MKERIKIIFALLRIWFYNNFLKMGVTLDPSDDSVTLSKALLVFIRPYIQERAEALIVKTEKYGYVIAINPALDVDNIPSIQYNSKYDCTGFHTPCPTVGNLLYEWGLSHDEVVRISVKARRTKNGMIIIELNR